MAQIILTKKEERSLSGVTRLEMTVLAFDISWCRSYPTFSVTRVDLKVLSLG